MCNMRPVLQKKIDSAIKLLKAYDNPLNPVEIAYSGGKDSDVILQLAKEAGINFRAIYKNTTIDPPGTIKHAEQMGVEIRRPEKTFFQIVAERGFPNRMRRFCCRVLKEYKILDKVVMGVRKAESVRRAKRYHEPSECRIYNKTDHAEAVYPILEWTNEDVADFIADRKIKCHPLYYDEQGNFHVERRLGCMGCPLAGRRLRVEVFKKHPRLVKCYIKSGAEFFASHPDGKIKTNYDGDIYAYFYRNLYCDSEQEFLHVATGLFGKPDFKAFLEKQFGITL